MKLEMRPFKEFAKVIGGYAFKSEDFVNEGIPVLKIKNIGDKSLSMDDIDFLPRAFDEINDKYKVKYGDILVSLTGSHITQPNSAVGRVARSRCSNTLLLNQRVGKIQVDTKKCDSNFIYYFMISDAFRDQVGLRARGAANQANVSGGDVEGIDVPNFELSYQQKVGTLLSSYDDIIENNLKRINLLEEMAKITFEEWFIRMKFPGHEEAIFDDEMGLHEGWDKKSLRELTSYINRGVTPKYVEDNGVFVINQRCIRKHRVNFSDSRLTSEKQKMTEEKVLQPLDVLVNSTGTGTLGRVAQLFTAEGKVTVDTHVTIVRASQDVCPYWLGRSLEALEPFIVNLGKGATNQQELGRDDLADIVKLNTPPDELFNKYKEVAEPAYRAASNLLAQNERLKEALDILLPRLMTSMIDIDQIELPEAMMQRLEQQENEMAEA